jgi:menaquinone-dependent protoporphyrinogen oxidase
VRVLVSYRSKMGGTAGIAELIGQALTDAGFQADVRPVSEVDRIEAHDAVLVGGVLYSGCWHRQARRFVKRQASALRTRPVWLFCSGPLNGSAAGAIPPVPSAGAMVKTHAGDWRDPERIRGWAAEVAMQLGSLDLSGGCMPNQGNPTPRGVPWP